MNNTQLLQELQLIKFGLLPDEILAFLGDTSSDWIELLDGYCEDPSLAAVSWPSTPPHVQIKFSKSSNLDIWFEVQFSWPQNAMMPSVSVKGDTLARGDQERWQEIIQTKLKEVTASDTDVPVYELFCLHLLPLLHDEMLNPQNYPAPTTADCTIASSAPTKFHALFTSHHLISPKKRRSLQQWSNSLNIAGFAKVGYPGVIYAQGEQGNVEEFVENVKAMQWLALRLRFLEPLPEGRGGNADAQGWIELEKVGAAVERMRQLGLENWIVEMGIGSRTS
ncbi:RWD domain-containing protein 2B [Favolaschia claudopus]|uniref:RWD domain-containing protein 2B n=1 Tax=Favolaschia claudopus TaxID=2862362 RepID=A0AAW0EHY2_9AGAR